jgi:hypothetical protein
MLLATITAEPKVTVIPTWDAASLAFQDAVNLPLNERFDTRYLFVLDADKTEIAELGYVLNSVLKRASTYYHPDALAGGYVVRINLRQLAPRDEDYKRLLNVYETEFAKRDFYFRTIRLVGEPCPPFKATDGNTYSHRDKHINEAALHAGPQYRLLEELLKSRVPIMRSDDFIVAATTTLRGGLYYKFRGYEKSDKNQTALDKFLARFGASEKTVADLRSSERAAMTFSGVTGKPRRIDAFYGTGTRPSAGIPLVTLTFDMFDEDTLKVDFDPIRNLLENRFRAIEAIVLGDDGKLEMALFDEKKELQDVVPPNVARDATIPGPHTDQLEPGISCLRCHLPNDGFKPFRNVVHSLVGRDPNKLDIAGDASSKEGRDDTLDRLAGLYSGVLDGDATHPNTPIKIARRNHSRFTFLTTCGMSPAKLGTALTGTFDYYQYSLVTPAKACRELGFNIDEAEATERLRQIIPKLEKNKFGKRPEDGIVGLLRAGESITRDQWKLVYSDVALRAKTQFIQEAIQPENQK